MKSGIFIFLFPLVAMSQEILIKRLPDNINTKNTEINFIQTNDSTAYFTAITELEGKLISNIYTAKFSNGEWRRKGHTKYSSNSFNTANIALSESEKGFFTIHSNEMRDCKIVYQKKNEQHGFHDISIFSSDKSLNTQPFVSHEKSHTVLYFVSDRKGGLGGLDIWLTIIDNDGKFGIPINAGNKINSSADEITPFYNKHNKMLYFSSNREHGSGGFDIYKSEGILNLWDKPVNVIEINTTEDELYITFYDENNGYFASNRQGANFESPEYCCNDIFSFKYSPSFIYTSKKSSKIHKLLPLDLYFHNDEPDSRTMNTKTNKTYKEAYISYFMMKTNYEKENSELGAFFEDVLKKNFNALNKVLETLLFDLSNGNNIELQIRGYASPLHNLEYNQNLSQRRISSVINYIEQFKNAAFKDYILSGSLIIKELPFGESNASEKTSDDANDKKKSIYSIEAMLERKIKIVDVILKE